MPKSSLIGHPLLGKAEELRTAGRSYAKIAAELGLPRGQVERYFLGRERSRGNSVTGSWVKPPPPDTAGLSPAEAARAHASWLKAMLAAASAGNAEVKELTLISAQYTAAMRFVARLDGALEITESQVVRSPAFQRVMRLVEKALADEPQAWVKVVAALRDEAGES